MPVTKLKLGAQHAHVLVRHSELAWGMGALVFIHGLGESRQMFIEAFDCGKFERYNLFAPDLPGFGNSPGGLDDSLTGLVQCLEIIIKRFNIPECILVGHGMGADLASWLAVRTLGLERVKAVVNIEGTLSEDSLVFGNMAIEAANDPSKTFQKWFKHSFMEKTILEAHIGKQPAYRRFYESLQMCRPPRFLNLARDMREKLYMDDKQSVVLPEHTFTHLHQPHLYCFGENGLNAKRIPAFEQQSIPHLVFKDAGHWLMLEHPLPFYDFLYSFTIKHMPARNYSERMKDYFRLRFKGWLDALPTSPKKLADKIRYFIRTRIKRRI